MGYIDPVIYSSFIKRRVTVRQYINHILSKSKSIISIEEVKNAFNLSENRFNRPLCENGNEILRAIAAIEYAKIKKSFAFHGLVQKCSVIIGAMLRQFVIS